MSQDTTVAAEPHGHDHGLDSGRGTFKSYMVGFALSVVLTAIPFWLVMTGVLADSRITITVIVACAIAQILVHTFCFLHVNTRAEGGWTLLAYVFTGVIVLITIAGSIWIMYHLNTNMMPGMMTGQASQTP